MGQNLQYKIGSYGTFDPQDFCKFCSQKHLEEILLVALKQARQKQKQQEPYGNRGFFLDSFL